MKKIILALVLITSVLLFSSVKVSALEEVEEDFTSSTTTETNDNSNLEDIVIIEEENKPSDMQIWVEENLGWLIGIPTGTLLAVIADILVLAKKNKKKDEEIKETSSLNKDAKKALLDTKELVANTKIMASRLETNVSNVIKSNEEHTALLVDTLAKVNNTLSNLELRIKQLEDVQEMIALHSKELVANGTAEKITKKIRG